MLHGMRWLNWRRAKASNNLKTTVKEKRSLLSLERLEDRQMLSITTWTGAGADQNWSTTANWLGGIAPTVHSTVVFDAAQVTGSFASNNDIAGLVVSQIRITDASATGDFTIGGNALTTMIGLTHSLTDGVATNVNLATINFGGVSSVSNAAGQLTFASDLVANFQLTFGGAGNTTVNGVVSGVENFVSGTGGLNLYLANQGTNAATLEPLANLIGANFQFGAYVQRVDFGVGTDTVPGDGTVLDRGGIDPGNPYGGIGLDNVANDIAAYFDGVIDIAEAGNYKFTTRSDDGSVLYIDGIKIVDNNFDQGMTNRSGTVTLTAGQHRIQMGHREGGGGAGMQASWEKLDGTTFARRLIEPGVLRQAGSNVIIKTGSGTLTFTGSNTYEGRTLVQSGTLVAQNDTALGTTTQGTVVDNGATLLLPGGVTIAGEDLTIGGAGVASGGALRSENSNTVASPITLLGSGTITSATAGQLLTISGNINAGANELTFSGDGNTTVTGVISGVLDQKSAGGVVGYYYNLAAAPTPVLIDPLTNLEALSPVQIVQTPRIDFGNGTQATPGVGDVLDRAGGDNNIYGGIGVTVNNDNIAGRWVGYIFIDETADYQFTTRSDDGSVLYINGVKVVDNNGSHGMANVTGTINLTAGFHLLEMGHYDGGSQAGAQLSWARISGANPFNRRIVEPGVLFSQSSMALIKNGAGTLTLAATNTYDGQTRVNQGRVIVAADGALGSTVGNTVVTDNGELFFPGGVNYATVEAVSISGDGVSGGGAIQSSGENTFNGNTTLATNSLIAALDGLFTISGNIAADGRFLTFTGAGDTTVTGVISGQIDVIVAGGLVGNYYNFDNAPNATNADGVHNATDSVAFLQALTPSSVILTPWIDFGDGTQLTPGLGTNLNRGGGNDNVAGGIGAVLDGDQMGALWQGYVNVPVDGNYFFTTRSDDGSFLYIDGVLVVNNKFFQGMTDRTNTETAGAAIPLTAGLHTIVMGWYEGGGGSGMVASWAQEGGFARRVLGPTDLFVELDNRVVKQGTGTLTLSGNNTYEGLTDIQEGTVVVTANNALGTIDNGTTVQTGAALGFAGNVAYTTAEAVSIAGNGTASEGALYNVSGTNSFSGVITVTNPATIGSNAGLLAQNGNIVANAALRFDGAGDVTVNGVISGQMLEFVSTGVLEANLYTSDATTRPTFPTIIDPIAGIEALTPTLTTTTPRVDFGTGTEAAVGDGTVLDRGGSGGTIYGGLGYTVTDDMLGLFQGYINIVDAGTYTFTTRSDDGSVLYIDGVRIVSNNFFQGMTNRSGSVFLAAGYHFIQVATYEGNGGAGIQASWQKDAGPGAFARQIISGAVFGTLASADLVKAGSGTVIFAANNIYGGNTIVEAGELFANNAAGGGSATSAGTVEVQAGGTIGGSGFITGDINVLDGGVVAPGPNVGLPGRLTVHNITMAPDARLDIDIAGVGAGVGYDQLVTTAGGALVVGTPNLTELAFNATGTDTTIVLVSNTTNALNAEFNTFPEGTDVILAGIRYMITYQFNDSNGSLTGGNDVALVRYGSIGDFVWDDLNGNGLQDVGEAGVANVTVNLYDAGGTTLISSTTTDATGFYEFLNLDAGTYVVGFDVSTAAATYVFTYANVGANDAIDSDASQSTGRTGGVAIDFGIDNSTIDAGLFILGIVSGTVFDDFTGNGPSADDAPLANVPVLVYLDNGDGVFTGGDTLVFSTSSLVGVGTYLFDNLWAGRYFVTQIVPQGFVQTFPVAPTFYTIDILSGTVVVGRDFANSVTGVGLGTDPFDFTKTALIIRGTDASDKIIVKQTKAGTYIILIYNKQRTVQPMPTGRIVIFGYAGNDKIELNHRVKVPALIFGGTGNDTIIGALGDDVLVGESGNDRLMGGRAGRDILIGGLGRDILRGHDERMTSPREDEDLIIGTALVGETDTSVLRDLYYAWTDRSTAYRQRVAALQAGVGSAAINSATLIDDGARDVLFGGPDLDFYVHGRKYQILDKRRGEVRFPD